MRHAIRDPDGIRNGIDPLQATHIGQFRLTNQTNPPLTIHTTDQTPLSSEAWILREFADEATELCAKRYQVIKFVSPTLTMKYIYLPLS